jgi:hypothetical protein
LDVETVGKELFGRPCRLALALWIAGQHKPRFYQSEPPREVILQGDLAKELGRLVRLGMLSGIPKVLFVTQRQPRAGPGRGGIEHLIR